ncbi:MAG: DUF3781 domain-containing protein [Spirochaetales bacterium]|nr:DUF3781 domain-containing protein [Spirochaetales bacterium]
MTDVKQHILDNLSYTPLVYGRVRKKLSIDGTDKDIEKLVHQTVKETPVSDIVKKGKNYYLYNAARGIRLTVISYTTRLITADAYL